MVFLFFMPLYVCMISSVPKVPVAPQAALRIEVWIVLDEVDPADGAQAHRRVREAPGQGQGLERGKIEPRKD